MADRLVQDDSEDLLDYHITFPSPISQDLYDEYGFEACPESSDQKEPVVILLGWAGCQDKHLAKYSAIYDQRRCITIRYSAPIDHMFYKGPRSLQPYALKILELITDMSLEENPVLFHIFSNGGGFIYQYCNEAIMGDERFQHLRVLGCTLDSAPGLSSPWTAAKVYMNTLNISTLLRYLIAVLFFLYVFTVNAICNSLRWVGIPVTSGRDKYWAAMLDDPSRWPQLFLYSKNDKIVRYQDIEYVIEHRKKLGVAVHSQCWDDTEHVAHLRDHREAYIKQCYDFLDYCLTAE